MVMEAGHTMICPMVEAEVVVQCTALPTMGDGVGQDLETCPLRNNPPMATHKLREGKTSPFDIDKLHCSVHVANFNTVSFPPHAFLVYFSTKVRE